MNIKNVKQVVTWELVGTEQRGVNPLWWFFWLIVFFPFLIFVFFVHNQDAEIIQLTYQNGDKLLIKLTRDDVNWFLRKMEKIGASQVEEDMVQYQNMKECPYCAEIIQGKAILCRYCHQKIESVIDEEAAETEAYYTEKIYTLDPRIEAEKSDSIRKEKNRSSWDNNV